jgi:KDO2-lipid IV(A) lauroyltransferase
LRKNGICVLVIDQNSKRSEGVFVDHFGKLASTYSAPYVLSKKFKCPVLPAFNYRDDNMHNHHTVILPEIPLLTAEDKEEEVKLNVRAYLKPFEDFLMEHPEQWIWMHQRWKSQPK